MLERRCCSGRGGRPPVRALRALLLPLLASGSLARRSWVARVASSTCSGGTYVAAGAAERRTSVEPVKPAAAGAESLCVDRLGKTAAMDVLASAGWRSSNLRAGDVGCLEPSLL
jgi:hypothetical protein